jgi:hypothetical protein
MFGKLKIYGKIVKRILNFFGLISTKIIHLVQHLTFPFLPTKCPFRLVPPPPRYIFKQ